MGLVISNLFENCKTHYNDLRDSGHKLLKLYYCLSYIHFYCFDTFDFSEYFILFYLLPCVLYMSLWLAYTGQPIPRTDISKLIELQIHSLSSVHSRVIDCCLSILHILSSLLYSIVKLVSRAFSVFSFIQLLRQHLVYSQFCLVFDCYVSTSFILSFFSHLIVTFVSRAMSVFSCFRLIC